MIKKDNTRELNEYSVCKSKVEFEEQHMKIPISFIIMKYGPLYEIEGGIFSGYIKECLVSSVPSRAAHLDRVLKPFYTKNIEKTLELEKKRTGYECSIILNLGSIDNFKRNAKEQHVNGYIDAFYNYKDQNNDQCSDISYHDTITIGDFRIMEDFDYENLTEYLKGFVKNK